MALGVPSVFTDLLYHRLDLSNSSSFLTHPLKAPPAQPPSAPMGSLLPGQSCEYWLPEGGLTSAYLPQQVQHLSPTVCLTHTAWPRMTGGEWPDEQHLQETGHAGTPLTQCTVELGLCDVVSHCAVAGAAQLEPPERRGAPRKALTTPSPPVPKQPGCGTVFVLFMKLFQTDQEGVLAPLHPKVLTALPVTTLRKRC